MPHTKPVIFGVLSLFLLAGLAPVALADEDREGKRGDDDRDKDRDHGEGDGKRGERGDDEHREGKDPDEKEHDDDDREGKRHHAPNLVNVTLDLSGSGTSRRDNLTYTVTLLGDGQAKERIRHVEADDDDEDDPGETDEADQAPPENLTKLKGRLLAHVVVKDQNGTVVREGNLTVKFQLRETDEGEWKWHLEAVKKKPKDMPKLNLRGTAEEIGDAAWDFDGRGKATFKVDDEQRATKVRLDVEGKLTAKR